MKDFKYLIENFFTHKDFLAPANELPGTMFTPLHFIIAGIFLALVIIFAIILIKHPKHVKTVFIIIWAVVTVFEVIKIVWESTTGKVVEMNYAGNLPLYPCSIFMYVMPFAIWGKGLAKKIACGYVCTLGLLGGSINFAYPMTILPRYSALSFAGFHTFIYHGVMLFTCIVMLGTGYHSYKGITKWYEPFLACIPSLIMSIPANIVNYTIGADYMFFRGKSAFLPALFGNTAEPVVTVIIYLLFIIIPALFYLPSLIANLVKGKKA